MSRWTKLRSNVWEQMRRVTHTARQRLSVFAPSVSKSAVSGHFCFLLEWEHARWPKYFMHGPWGRDLISSEDQGLILQQ